MIRDTHAIVALARLVDDLVLKSGRTFAVFDQFGDVNHGFAGEQGVFVGGTRFLSRWSLLVDGERPEFLGSSVFQGDNTIEVDLTNRDITSVEHKNEDVCRESVHIRRSLTLEERSCAERLTVHNFADCEAPVALELHFDADFSDIFEVRGEVRPARGRLHEPQPISGGMRLGYEGLDGVTRETTVSLSPEPDLITGGSARYDLSVRPRQTFEINIRFEFSLSTDREGRASRRRVAPGDDASPAAPAPTTVQTSSELASRWLSRSIDDIRMLTTELDEGPYPFAGIPWYCTVFGRDGIITALQALWWDPSLARGVLRHLAATQATTADPSRDAEPGKILHESREGEMAALREIPFGRYYGTVDATPLFVVLAGRYFARTGDRETIADLWPSIEAALRWMDQHGDLDGDGFIEYDRRSADGLDNQGWKDSSNSIMHADGSPGRGAIALCEVQGYAYAAWRRAADLAEALGRPEQAEAWRLRASDLQRRFHEAYWDDSLACYALALDGDKRRCAVRSSNPGHCLYTGIVPDEFARPLADSLLAEDMFCGWGIRTLSAATAAYNPMSYHNGTVWPHDNALAAAGFARYGLTAHACTVTRALLDASMHFDRQRLPELFCGFRRHHGKGPVPYPVACSPQAWAAGAPLMLLQAMLGLAVDTPRCRLRLTHPALPEGIDWIRLRDLRLGETTLDLRVARTPRGVSVEVERRTGPCELAVVSAPGEFS